MILETTRTYLRELTPDDYSDLCEILQDKDCMYAYEHAFSDAEATAWLDRQIMRYQTYGFGLWALIDRESGVLVGQVGLTMQPVEDTELLEIGYLLKRRFWHQGYATEAAAACRDYAFHVLDADCVCSIIRENNIASRGVAERIGMLPSGKVVKHYYNMEMPHIIYRISR